MNEDLSSFSMMDLFRMEAETQIAALSTGLIELEGDPGAASKRAEELMRAAHSMKGAARLVNLDLAVQIAHSMEDVFVAIQEGRLTLLPEHVDPLLRTVDFLTEFSKLGDDQIESWTAGHQAETDGLMSSLKAILTPGRAAAPPVPAPTPPAAAEAVDLANASMLDLFQTELATQTALLSEGLLALETSPSEPNLLRSSMQAAHSLKGAASVVGLAAVVHVAHQMENCFVLAQEGRLALRPQHVDVMLRCLDLLRTIPNGAETAVMEWVQRQTPAAEALVRRMEGFVSEAPEPVAVASPAVETKPASPSTTMAAVPAPAPAAPPARHAPVADRVVRVGAENLNRLMELAAESLVEARRMQPFADSMLLLKSGHSAIESALSGLRDSVERGGADRPTHLAQLETRVESMRQTLAQRLQDFEGLLRRTTALSDRLYQEVIASRMRPFGDGVTGFPRMVRDLARSLGKKVRLNILGKGTEVDRDILEKLEAPLNHILRNALDHGLELPADRLAAGKPEEGQLKLEARHSAGMLYITLSDDGRGVNRDKLRKKIVDKGMVPAQAAAQLNDAELFEFLFLPGFSTADKITEISGRGVGLDVVQNMVQEVGGTVRIVSQAGAGTSFHLQLPITRSVIRALIARISGHGYAFPLPRIDQVLRLEPADLETLEGRQYIRRDGKNIGIVSACEVLELPCSIAKPAFFDVLVVSDRNHQYGLEVDAFLGERDLVVRPLDPRLGKVPDISSASVLEDGSPILIVDVDDLVRSIDNKIEGGNFAKARKSDENVAAVDCKRVLVTDDSITVRELERQLLRAQGYEVDVAVDGMEGWHAVRLGHYDLVVSDVDMPRMTGIEFVKLIRNDERLKAMPVIIVSYKDREEDRLRGLEAGANYYLTKSSFQDDTFLRAVQDLIGKAVE